MALEPKGDVALEYAADSGAEDEEDGEEEGLDVEEGNRSNNSRPLSKSSNRCRKVKVDVVQMRKEIDKLSKGAKSDTSRKTRRPKLTRHERWQVTKFCHEDGIKKMKEEMSLTIQKAFKTVVMLLDETHRALWNQVLVKI